MTDRYWGVLVEFEEPVRDDDYRASVGALLGMLRDVKSVQPLLAEGFGEEMVRRARDQDWEDALREFVYKFRWQPEADPTRAGRESRP